MNKLKNIGLSALAGTLAGSLMSLSAAQAGGVSVTGSWELSYTNKNSDKVTGNKIGMNKNIAFGASGDVSDGGAVTWATTIGGSDAMGLSSASMNINMGGIATLAYDSGTGGYGANAVDNVVPTAWEEIDYGLSTGIADVGAVSASKGVVNLTIKAPTAGTALSVSFVNEVGGGHIADGGTSGTVDGGKGIDAVLDFVNYSAPHFGFRWGMAGEVTVKEKTCKKEHKNSESRSVQDDQEPCLVGHKDHPYAATSYMTLKLGPLSIGTQATFKDPMDPTLAGIKNIRAVTGGAALQFGKTLSVSYGASNEKRKYNDDARGISTSTYEAPEMLKAENPGYLGEWETISYRGWSAAINLGPAALKATRNHVGGVGENAGNSGRGLQKSHSEVNLSIAF